MTCQSPSPKTLIAAGSQASPTGSCHWLVHRNQGRSQGPILRQGRSSRRRRAPQLRAKDFCNFRDLDPVPSMIQTAAAAPRDQPVPAQKGRTHRARSPPWAAGVHADCDPQRSRSPPVYKPRTLADRPGQPAARSPVRPAPPRRALTVVRAPPPGSALRTSAARSRLRDSSPSEVVCAPPRYLKGQGLQPLAVPLATFKGLTLLVRLN